MGYNLAFKGLITMKIHQAISFLCCLLHVFPTSLSVMFGEENTFLSRSFCCFLHFAVTYPPSAPNTLLTNLLLTQLGIVPYDKN